MGKFIKKISDYISPDSNHFYDLKNAVYDHSKKAYNFPQLATLISKELVDYSIKNKNNDFIEMMNEEFYSSMEKGIQTSRLKIFISELIGQSDFKEEMNQELQELKTARKNIGSVITTNYDTMIEEIFEFERLIGNNILLSNPYGSVYKIHGCTTKPEGIIINNEDYIEFNEKYELIRAQLLSLFIHNPIIFIGYSINDEYIQKILETIFKYVDPNSSMAEKITNNFLVIEYDENNPNTIITDYDKIVDEVVIKLNKLKTDDFSIIFQSIAELKLPISVMDVRKVRSITGDIYRGGPPENSVQVKITEDIDELDNSDKMLAIGTEKTINYVHSNSSEIYANYFSIIDENNHQILEIIDKLVIQSQYYFPIFGFSNINENIEREEELKEQQLTKINEQTDKTYGNPRYQKEFSSVNDILESDEPKSNRHYIIIYNFLEENIKLNDLKEFY